MKKILQKNLTSQKQGFTLIEMVISMGIFMIFLTAVFGTYIQITSTQQKANLNREAVSEAREIMSLISDETKEKAIDYSCYGAGSVACIDGFVNLNEVNQVGLISKDGLERTIISKRFDDDLNSYIIESSKQIRDNTNRDWVTAEVQQATPLHSETLKLQNVAFYITPNRDPFELNLETANNSALQFQPNLHIIMNVKRKQTKDNEIDENPIILETSLSSRIYNSF